MASKQITSVSDKHRKGAVKEGLGYNMILQIKFSGNKAGLQDAIDGREVWKEDTGEWHWEQS